MSELPSEEINKDITLDMLACESNHEWLWELAHDFRQS